MHIMSIVSDGIAVRRKKKKSFMVKLFFPKLFCRQFAGSEFHYRENTAFKVLNAMSCFFFLFYGELPPVFLAFKKSQSSTLC